MSTHTTNEKTTITNTGAPRPTAQDAKLHSGPIASLLVKVSKLSGDYTHYQMETCTGRKLAI